MRTQVKDHEGLVKVDGAYVVNEDAAAYAAARARRKAAEDSQRNAQRLDALEGKMDTIMSLLMEIKKGTS